MSQLTIYNFTDPFCVWCWGSEPFLRRLELEYEDLELYEYIGLLIPDVRQIHDPEKGIFGFELERTSEAFLNYWQSTEATHGMPIAVEGLQLFKAGRSSTLPAEMALEAAHLTDETLFKPYLRRQREALFTEQVPIHDEDEILRLAEDVGLDLAVFTEMLTNGRAKSLYYEGLETADKYGIKSYPSSIIVWEEHGEQVGKFLEGFVSYDAYVKAITELTHGKMEAKPLAPTASSLKRVAERFPTLASQEIREILQVDEEAVVALAKKVGLSRKEVGASAIYSAE